MQDIRTIIKELNKLCDELSNKFYINSGGCCYIAYLIAKHLDKMHIKYTLCVATNYHLNVDSINKELKYRRHFESCNHSITGKNTANHYYIHFPELGDINEDRYSEDHLIYSFNINSKKLKWIYDTGEWNNTYDVDNNILIEHKINICFDEIRKNRKMSKM